MVITARLTSIAYNYQDGLFGDEVRVVLASEVTLRRLAVSQRVVAAKRSTASQRSQAIALSLSILV